MAIVDPREQKTAQTTKGGIIDPREQKGATPDIMDSAQGMGNLHPEVIKSLKNMAIGGVGDPVTELSNLVNKGLLSIPGAKKLISPKHQKEFLGQVHLPHEKGIIPKIQRGAGGVASFLGVGAEEAGIKSGMWAGKEIAKEGPKVLEEAMKVAPKIGKAAGTLAEKLSPLGKSVVARAASLGTLADPSHPAMGAATGTAGALLGEAGAKIAGEVIPPGIKFAKTMLRGALRKGYSNEMFPYFKGRVNTILKDLQGTSSSETSNRDLFDRVARNYAEKEGHGADIHGNPITEKTAQYTKPSESVSSDYGKARELSQEIPYKFNAEPLRKSLTTESRKMATDAERYKEAPLFREDAEKALDLMKNVRNTRLQTFDDADSLKRTLNDFLFKKDVPKKVKESLYDVKQGLLDSTKNTYKSKPELYKIWRGADERYKSEIVPFKETRRGIKSPFIKAHTGDAEIVDKFGSNYIKPESPDLLKNFMKIIPDANTRKLAAYDYLKRSGANETADNPAAFISQAKKLSSSQLKTLAPEHAEEIQNMIKMEKKVPRAFKVPKEEVGGLARMMHYAPHLMTGMATFGATKDFPLAVASMLAPSIARKGARSFLKTAAGRKFFMEEIESKLRGLGSRSTSAGGVIGATSALSQLNRGKQ